MDELIKTLLTLVALVVLTGVSSWMQKRARTDEAEEERDLTESQSKPRPTRPLGKPSPAPRHPASTTRPPQPRPRPARPTTWEEELRRLLEGELAPTSPPPPPPPPPLVVRDSAPQPAPVFSPPPRVIIHTPPTAMEVEEEGAQLQLTELSESKNANQRAHKLQQDALKKLHDAGASVAPPAKIQHRGVAAQDVTSMVRGIRGHSQLRQAFVASLIFGPPKAFDP